MPLRTSEALREAHPDLVALEVVAGAAHVGSWNVDPQRYDARLGRSSTRCDGPLRAPLAPPRHRTDAN